VREECYHSHRLAPALQIAGTATITASVEGLIWKIWVMQEQKSEMGGMYLFANRESAEAYMNHPVIQAMRSNPAVVSVLFQIWDVETSLSALTRAPLQDIRMQHAEPVALVAGGQ